VSLVEDTSPCAQHTKQLSHSCSHTVALTQQHCPCCPPAPDDPDLVHWTKLPQPLLPAPPPGMSLNSWRDPFLANRPEQHSSTSAGGPTNPAQPTTIDLPEADTSAACAVSPATQAEGITGAAGPRSCRWQMLIGSGIVGSGEVHEATALVYSSPHLTSGRRDADLVAALPRMLYAVCDDDLPSCMTQYRSHSRACSAAPLLSGCRNAQLIP
jgi:hypothetical protein